MVRELISIEVMDERIASLDFVKASVTVCSRTLVQGAEADRKQGVAE